MSPRSSPQPLPKPDADVKTTSMFRRQNSARRADGVKQKFTGTCRFRLPRRAELLPVRYLQHLSHKVVAALRLVSRRRAKAFKDITSSTGRAKPFVAPVDSHRAKAIDDCIEFIKSSSSSKTSNSVAG